MPSRRFKAAVAAAAFILAAPLPALAQMQGPEQHHGQSEDRSGTAPAAPSGMMGSGTMGPGMMQMAPQGMMPGQMQMPMMGPGMMNGGMMGGGMMGGPMMSQMMRRHPGMMAMMHGGDMSAGGGMMTGPGAMGLAAWVVTPIQHLSADDARHFFQYRLQQIGNDRLKLGEVTQADDDTITVEIVTVDDSLVDRLEVDRHSGRIQRAQ